MKANRRRRPSYGWPVLFTLLGAAAVATILSVETGQRQTQNFSCLMAGLIWFLALVVWLIFFSRLPVCLRLAAAAIMVLLAASVRVRGVSGDFVPLFEWRWSGSDAVFEGSGDRPPVPGWASTSNDYGQFLGPNRNGILTGAGLVRDWEREPPQLVWRRSIGEGWSSFAVMGRRALTQEQDGPEELVSCYDLLTGEVLWTHADSTRYQTTLGGIGPRATPTVERGRVLAMGATGFLNCLDLTTGSVIWQRNVVEDHTAKVPMWGMAGSPLVLDGVVIVAPGGTIGGSLAAYDSETGGLLWSGGGKRAGYSSPQFTTIAGRDQILIFTSEGLVGHDPDTGDILWDHPWEGTDFCISQPIPLPGDRVFASTGYGVGGRLFQITAKGGRQTARQVWQSTRLKAKFTNVIQLEDVLFGLDDGVMTAVNVEDGSRRWKAGRYGHGQIMMVDDILLVVTEGGEVIMLEANPDAHVILGRFQAVEGKTWNHAALAAPYLLVRNDLEAACYRLPVEPAGPPASEGESKGDRNPMP